MENFKSILIIYVSLMNADSKRAVWNNM